MASRGPLPPTHRLTRCSRLSAGGLFAQEGPAGRQEAGREARLPAGRTGARQECPPGPVRARPCAASQGGSRCFRSTRSLAESLMFKLRALMLKDGAGPGTPPFFGIPSKAEYLLCKGPEFHFLPLGEPFL